MTIGRVEKSSRDKLPSVVSPVPIVDAINGFDNSAAMNAAVELDLFTAIGSGTDTAELLAAKFDLAERGVRILTDVLTVNGYLEKNGERYSLAPLSEAFLDRRSPACISGIVDFLAAPETVVALMDEAAEAQSAGTAEMGEIWAKFGEAMSPIVFASAEDLAAEVAVRRTPPRKVLDIAANHGLFGIAIARVLPKVEIFAVDWPSALALAERNAESAGVTARFRTIPGGVLEVDLGGEYDLVLLPNFVHHLDLETSADLLARIEASLSPAARASLAKAFLTKVVYRKRFRPLSPY